MQIDQDFPEKTPEQENGMSKNEMNVAKRIERERKKKEREDERRNAKTRRSKDDTWSVKNRKTQLG